MLGGRARVPLEILGAVLALFPVAALTWALVHEWLVRRGLPVETLMPLELARADQDAAMETGRLLWRHFAPALVLSVRRPPSERTRACIGQAASPFLLV